MQCPACGEQHTKGANPDVIVEVEIRISGDAFLPYNVMEIPDQQIRAMTLINLAQLGGQGAEAFLAGNVRRVSPDELDGWDQDGDRKDRMVTRLDEIPDPEVDNG